MLKIMGKITGMNQGARVVVNEVDLIFITMNEYSNFSENCFHPQLYNLSPLLVHFVFDDASSHRVSCKRMSNEQWTILDCSRLLAINHIILFSFSCVHKSLLLSIIKNAGFRCSEVLTKSKQISIKNPKKRYCSIQH